MSPPNQPITQAHREHLNGIGLTGETVDLAGIFSESDPKKIQKVLGSKRACKGGGIVFPYHIPGKARPVYHSVRLDNPIPVKKKDGGWSTIRYLRPARSASRSFCYFPPRAIASGLNKTETPLYFLEGEKKALLVDQLGYPCIAAPGVWSFHDSDHREICDEWQLSIEILKHAHIPGRVCRILFDADAETNKSVYQAGQQLAGMLLSAGAGKVEWIRIPGSEKDPKRGIDDFFASEGEEATRRIMISGGEIEPLPTASQIPTLNSWRYNNQAPISDRLKTPKSYLINKKGELWEVVQDKDPARISHRVILPVRIVLRVLEGELRESVELTYRRTVAAGKTVWAIVSIPREDCMDTRRITMMLSRQGGPVDSNSARGIVNWLSACLEVNERLIPRVVGLDQGGWCQVYGEDRYVLGSEILPSSNDVVFSGTSPVEAESSGTWEDSTRAVRALVGDSKLGAVAVAGSLAAPLLKFSGVPGFMIHLFGDSSRGKTTIQMVAASVWGNPGKSGEMLFKPRSIPGLEAHAWRNCDLPLFPEETTTLDDDQKEDMIYLLANGQGRLLGQKGGGSRERLSWRCVSISSGEGEFADDCANSGAQARVLQFQVTGIGDYGAVEVDWLGDQVGKNYGHIGGRWIRILLGIGAKALAAKYLEVLNSLPEARGIQARQRGYWAALIMAEELAEEHMSMGKGLVRGAYLNPKLGVSKPKAAGDRGIEVLSGYLSSNPYETVLIERVMINGRVGRVDVKEAVTGKRNISCYYDKNIIWILPTRLAEILAKGNVSSKVALRGFVFLMGGVGEGVGGGGFGDTGEEGGGEVVRDEDGESGRFGV